MTTTISSKGQITVPVKVREKLGLAPGTRIELELGPDGTFVGRKSREGSFFAQFVGVGAKSGSQFRDGDEAVEILRGTVEPGDVD